MIFTICYLLLLASLTFGFIRLTKGPSILNRILAFDTVAISSIAILIVFSIQHKTADFLEIILIFCLLGFVSTVAMIDYLFKTTAKEKSDGRK